MNYLDKLLFDKKIKEAVSQWCRDNSLTFYEANLSVFVSGPSRPSYLANMSTLSVDTITCMGIDEAGSRWENLRIPTQHENGLAQLIFQKLGDDEEKRHFYRHGVKFISPDSMAEMLQGSIEDLKAFLIEKKSSRTKPWIKGDIQDFAFLVIEGLAKDEAPDILHKILKNNKAVFKSPAEQARLYAFINLYIEADKREGFQQYYQDLKKSQEVNLFEYPQNILTIDIHKHSLQKCFNIPYENYYHKFFDNLVYAVGRKETKNLLGVEALQIGQKKQEYDSYRLTMNMGAIPTMKGDHKSLIEAYLKKFIHAYKNNPEKADNKGVIAAMNKSIVLSMELEASLQDKPASAKKNKI